MSAKGERRGFTLVELLIVIVIIGMLVALLLPAITGVLRRAAEFRAAAEVAKLGQAVEAYKTQHGDFPPDFSELRLLGDNDDLRTLPAFNQSAIIGHLRKAYPKIEPAEISRFKAYLYQGRSYLGPADALNFWLGGMSANVKRPFTGAGGPLIVTDDGNGNTVFLLRVLDRHEPTFTFDEGQLIVNDTETSARYYPPDFKAPYIYFDSGTYATARFDYASDNIALPYVSIVSRNTVRFVNRNTFQIICAGKDDIYAPPIPGNPSNADSPPLLYTTDKGRPWHPENYANPNLTSPNEPDGSGATLDPAYQRFFEGQEDNLTNFGEGQRLDKNQDS